jgi:hypothetical protein
MKNKIIQFISFFLIITIITPSVLFYKPKKADAVVASWLTDLFTGQTAVSTTTGATADVTQTAFTIKDFAKDILKQVIMSIEKRLLAQMTKSTVNWINSGFHGSPLFLENPESFFKDIAKYEMKNFINTTGYDQARFPFGKDFALNVINSYKQKADSNLEYTLSKALNNNPQLVSQYRSNFLYGGWNGFLINTQYPQNNYVGYQIIATDQLARKLDGISQNNVQKVQTALQEGMGFLSPQTCPDNNGNNEYNKVMANQFKRPVFTPKKIYKFEATVPNIINGEYNPEYIKQKEAYDRQYQIDIDAEKEEWSNKNTCLSGLVTTTPGSVVANQITTALSSNFRQTELGAAVGSSMSAIFDALLKSLLDKGLNSLASKINPKPVKDEWTYEGQTLGVATDINKTAWDSGPDEVIVLKDFKKLLNGKSVITKTDSTGAETTIEEIGNTGNGVYIPGDIDNTKMELALMDNADTTNPGITQALSQTWPKIRELDMCLPGPDLGWKDRIIKEMNRNSEKLQEKANQQDGEKAAAAQLVYNDLQFAVNSYKDWVNDQMIMSLPGAVIYMDAIDGIETLYQQSEELITKKRKLSETLARLGAIKSELDEITTDPEPGSIEEKELVALKKRYNAIAYAVSNTSSTEDTRNDLSISLERLKTIDKLLAQCNKERKTKGWSTPGGVASTFTPKTTNPTTTTTSDTEKSIFCEAPISGGYAHGAFQNNGKGPNNTSGPVTHPTVPLVNGQDVFKYLNKLTAIFTLGIGGHKTVNIKLSCNLIYNTSVFEYKKDLPGLTNIVDTFVNQPADYSDGTESGTCNVGGVVNTSSQQSCIDKGGSWSVSN